MNEVWFSYISVATWQDAQDWITFWKNAQEILGTQIAHLDCKDPVTRKVNGTDLDSIANYILIIFTMNVFRMK